ncbi:DUF4823 domain-containing protein [Dasania marina]|uniref:DUF4823 domain-containing protein n=1 Tax=Dasania marina TaxID=471499 RepID=UPI000371DE25|nr:DUF4823 domain-containing protein [Dasania marina]
MNSCKVAGAAVLALLLTACEPAYIIDGAQHYSRQLGIVNDYNISRWHSYVYARESSFVIAGLVADKNIQQPLLQVSEQAFAVYFARAVSVNTNTFAAALQQAKSQRASFLAVFTLSSLQQFQNLDGSYEAGYQQADVLITLYDVNSAKVVDKVSLKASKSLLSFAGENITTLLHKPMLAVAAELSGGQ